MSEIRKTRNPDEGMVPAPASETPDRFRESVIGLRPEWLPQASAVDRSKTDFYRTPSDATVALLQFLALPTDTMIWEPACGDGVMVGDMKALGYSVVATNLHDQGYGEVGVDFTAQLSSSARDNRIDWIITNPPFSASVGFIETALRMAVPFAFLLKSQYWHAAERLDLFRRRSPAYVLPLTWRPDFLFGAKSGASVMEVCWTVWLGQDFGTEYVPLPRPPWQPHFQGVPKSLRQVPLRVGGAARKKRERHDE